MKKTLFEFDNGMRVELEERAVRPIDIIIPSYLRVPCGRGPTLLSLSIDEAMELSVALHATAVKAKTVREALGKDRSFSFTSNDKDAR